jgi:hypothetical protein
VVFRKCCMNTIKHQKMESYKKWRHEQTSNWSTHTQKLHERMEYITNCVRKGHKSQGTSSQDQTMDREHNSTSSPCNQVGCRFHWLQQEHITASGTHQLSMPTQLHVSLQLWMQHKVRHKLTSCLRFQNITWRILPLASLKPSSANLGDAPSWDVLLQSADTIKVGSLGWDIRQDDGTGWSMNSGSQSRTRFLNVAYAVQLSWLGKLTCPPDINLYCLGIRDLNLLLLQC